MKNTALWIGNIILLCFASCSVQKQISRQARHTLINNEALSPAHVGITFFDAGKNKYIYNYHGQKNFIPASNTKLFTLYAGLKYLSDSIVAARYKVEDGTVMLQATGDPTFLHPDFETQPLLDFLQQKDIGKISINTDFAAESFGRGWAWDDFQAEYMPERDPFPMYGNLAAVSYYADSLTTVPAAIKPFIIGMPAAGRHWQIMRELGGHIYTIDTAAGNMAGEKKITMAMGKGLFASRYLADTLHKEVVRDYNSIGKSESIPVFSQPKDSVFKIMMHRSDNFFAEQTLLMVSYEKFGVMSDVQIIDTLLATDFIYLPQKPRWIDGSGLSRYNLLSPQNVVWILNKLKEEFGMERLKVILPGANEGSMEGLYKGYENRIFAKTGTLSNNIALSGYLFTKKNKTLLFSLLINNHRSSALTIRKLIESFITGIIEEY